VLAEQVLLPRELRRRRVDLLHNLFTTAPGLPGSTQVTTILDVIYKRFPETHSGVLGKGLAALTWLAARRSARVIAISESAKRDIVELLKVPRERVDVTYLGPGLPPAGGVDEVEVRRALDLSSARILLSVSAKRPHKNLERLFDAFSTLPGDLVLVVPGYPTFHEPALRARADERVRFTGWLSEELLDGLYRAADCMVFASLAEGFGLPVLDALVRGTPVACSNASSLPEVGGQAVLYFDPQDPAAIAGAIERILTDVPLRERLRTAGPKQAAKFSWTRTAEQTLATYRRALETGPPPAERADQPD
jgi:glycosyltransferase involved in cell wall biosynthesis